MACIKNNKPCEFLGRRKRNKYGENVKYFCIGFKDLAGRRKILEVFDPKKTDCALLTSPAK